MRFAWIGLRAGATLAATAIAAEFAYQDPNAHSDEGLLAFCLVVVAVIPLVAVHEAGHAVAARLVGYRVEYVGFTLDLDAVTYWRPAPGRGTPARSAVVTAGGPLATILSIIVLVAVPLEGFWSVWRAGLVTFAVLWLADLLVPLHRPRFEVQRDGYELKRLWTSYRESHGVFDAGTRAQLASLDAAILRRDVAEARRLCQGILDLAGTEHPYQRAAVATRFAIVALLDGRPEVIAAYADSNSAEAIRCAPHDPLAAAVRDEVRRRLGQRKPPIRSVRRIRPDEEALLQLVQQRSNERSQ